MIGSERVLLADASHIISQPRQALVIDGESSTVISRATQDMSKTLSEWADELKGLALRYGVDEVWVDAVGVGHAVFDVLRKAVWDDVRTRTFVRAKAVRFS